MSATAPGRGTFARGVHPPEGKHFAEEAAIEVLPTPKEVKIPLVQHIGAPCAAVVKPRKPIALGDEVGKAQGFISSPVHASVSGKTARSGQVTLPSGQRVEAIPIAADEEQALEGQALFEDVLGGEWDFSAIDEVEADAISGIAREAGIVGLGGATFPSHVKLSKNPKKPIDTVLINGCECEPYLTADYRLMLEAPESVVAGTLLAMKANAAQHAIIGVEDNKPLAIEALQKAAKGTKVEVLKVQTKYPQGGEKQLIYAALDREVPTGGLPLEVGVVVMNVGTCSALARAVLRGKPLTHRVVTITGAGIKSPKNVLAPIGVSYRELIDYAGGLRPQASKVISGGPMMGFTVGDLDAPITKGTSGITVLSKAEARRAETTNCVRCGRCVDVCPLKLVPTKIALAARFEAIEVAEAYFAMACMECGSCAYVCPAALPLVQLIRMSKQQLRAHEAAETAKRKKAEEKEKAEQSRADRLAKIRGKSPEEAVKMEPKAEKPATDKAEKKDEDSKPPKATKRKATKESTESTQDKAAKENEAKPEEEAKSNDATDSKHDAKDLAPESAAEEEKNSDQAAAKEKKD